MDWLFIILVIPAMIFSLIASVAVKSTFKKYSSVRSTMRLTGREAAQTVLDANGVTGVSIGNISGDLTDHFDPSANVIRLSDPVYNNDSIAAIGVAAHEAGHAVQHAEHYFPAAVRSAIVPVTNFGSRLSTPLIIIGILLSSVSQFFVYVAYAGVILFGLCVIFQLVTLPTEINASRRAIKAIESKGLLTKNELPGAKSTLRAAAMTYVAALAMAVAQFLRLLVIVSGSSRRKR